METILATVTVISLAVAAGMGVLLARLVREERRRSDARVALLTELAAADEPVAAVTFGPRPATAHVEAGERPAIASIREPVLDQFDDFELRETGPAAASGTLFAGKETRSAWPFRLAAAAGVIAIVAGLAFGVGALSSGERQETEEQIVTAAVAQPLELLSLAHRHQDGDLTISGLVQNPAGGRALSRVEATVLAIDSTGEQIASGRAPIDVSTLAPGEESPFLVRVKATNVARYRVSFRGEGDQPLAHVDRRNLDALARKE